MKGISIDTDINTFFVQYFEHRALNAPPEINQIFTEALKDKVRSESRLDYTTTDPDIEFSGIITNYIVRSEAPEPDETTGLNRLEIRFKVTYVNHLREDDTWESNFMHYYEYPSETTLADVQNEAHEIIFDQVTEDIFNKAFTDW